MPAPIAIRRCWSIIHGKGAFAGHYGNVIKQAAAKAALRVDRARSAALRHVRSGQSRQEPGADRCRTCATSFTSSWSTSSASSRRSISVTRSAASVILGYALNWPDAVQGLMLEAPAGLEEYPRRSRDRPGQDG